MREEPPDRASIASLLAAVGIVVEPDKIAIEGREDRWLVRLGEDRLAWLPAGALGVTRLAIDRRVLKLIGERCDFEVPRILADLPGGGDVRRMVPGTSEPWRMAERLGADPVLARRVGNKVGEMLVQQHSRVAESDVRGWLRRRVTWPEPADWMRCRLPEVIDDLVLLADLDAVIARWDAEPGAKSDMVLIHGDLGLHNMAFDEASGEVRGLFDYDSAAWADRHYDFRYLEFDLGRSHLMDAAVEAYQAITGMEIDRGRVNLLNAASAICYLAYRRGVDPLERWCGRTLAEDLAWVRWSMGRLV